MNLLKTINPENIAEENAQAFKTREAVRAVLQDNNGDVALLHVKKHNYYKLPGGGIDEGEEEMEALARECMEETGCKIEVGKEIGTIIEYREKFQLKQTSHCYMATVVEDKGEPSFTDKETNDGFELIWVKPEEALKIVSSASPSNYEGNFIKERDTIFIEDALKILN